MKSKLANIFLKQAELVDEISIRLARDKNPLYKSLEAAAQALGQAAITTELLEETVDEYKKEVGRLTECRDLYKNQLETLNERYKDLNLSVWAAKING